MADKRIEIAAHLATTVAAIVAIVTLIFGFFQFRETQRMTREALRLQTDTLGRERQTKAVDLFVKFNEIQREAVASQTVSESEKAASFWRQNLLLSITESIFLLTEGDAGWKATTVWMLELQKDFLTSMKCSTVASQFVALVRTVMKSDDVCAPETGETGMKALAP